MFLHPLSNTGPKSSISKELQDPARFSWIANGSVLKSGAKDEIDLQTGHLFTVADRVYGISSNVPTRSHENSVEVRSARKVSAGGYLVVEDAGVQGRVTDKRKAKE